MNSSITHPQRLLVISFMLIFGCGASTPSPAPPPPGAPQPPQTIRQEPAQAARPIAKGVPQQPAAPPAASSKSLPPGTNPEDVMLAMDALTQTRLAAAGYSRYEISNWA